MSCRRIEIGVNRYWSGGQASILGVIPISFPFASGNEDVVYADRMGVCDISVKMDLSLD